MDRKVQDKKKEPEVKKTTEKKKDPENTKEKVADSKKEVKDKNNSKKTKVIKTEIHHKKQNSNDFKDNKAKNELIPKVKKEQPIQKISCEDKKVESKKSPSPQNKTGNSPSDVKNNKSIKITNIQTVQTVQNTQSIQNNQNLRNSQNIPSNKKPMDVTSFNHNVIGKVIVLIKNSIEDIQNKKDNDEIIKRLTQANGILISFVNENDKIYKNMIGNINILAAKNNNLRNSITSLNKNEMINNSNNNLEFKKKEYPNGDVYEGQFKDDKKEGEGKYYYKNGNIYTGEFKNDIAEGKGTFFFLGGNKYVGDLKNGKAHGKGTYYWTNGNRYEGDWKNGKRIGQGAYFYKNGDIEIGNFNEKPIGKFAKLNTSGELALIQYTED